MCQRHSFILTRTGKVHDGYGVTDSHTVIRELAGLHANDDTVNAYEWQPPKGWPDVDWNLGLTKDLVVFETKSSHESAIERHILALYPSMDAWNAGDKYRSMEGLTVGGSLDLRVLTSAEGLVLPTTVGGYLYLSGLTSAEGLVLPTTVGGSLDLSGLTSAEGLGLPTSGGGSRGLGGLTSGEGVVLPTTVGGSLYLSVLTSAEGLVLPTTVGGS